MIRFVSEVCSVVCGAERATGWCASLVRVPAGSGATLGVGRKPYLIGGGAIGFTLSPAGYWKLVLSPYPIT